MADYPGSIFDPREVENLPTIAFDADETTTLFAEDTNGANAEIVAIEETVGVNPQGSYMTVAERLDDLALADDVVPYTGAAHNVDLGTNELFALRIAGVNSSGLTLVASEGFPTSDPLSLLGRVLFDSENSGHYAEIDTSLLTGSTKVFSLPDLTGNIIVEDHTFLLTILNYVQANYGVQIGTPGDLHLYIQAGSPTISTTENSLPLSIQSGGHLYITPVAGSKVMFNGLINCVGLPTSDPGTVGDLWNDSGTLRISI